MTQIEKIKAEIERRKNQFVSQAEAFHKIGKEDKESYYAALASNMNSLSCFLDTLEEDSVSEDLEKAAWQYYDRNKPLMPSELDLHKELIDFFKAGVRWKEQNDSNLSEVLYRDNLDEMAEEYSSCTYLEEVLGEGDIEVLKARLKNTFKAGAQWQKEKILAKTCDWFADNYSKYIITSGLATIFSATIDFDTIRMIEDFKKAMEE